MPGSEKKEEKTCEYKLGNYECQRKLHDEEHCIFHSPDKKGKKDTFMDAFRKEYESQIKKGQLIFTGFVFPLGANLQGVDLQGAILCEADLYMAKLQEANLFNTNLQGASLFGAWMDGAFLQGTDLRGTNLGNTSLEKAKIFNVKYDRSTLFLGIDVSQAKGSQRV